MNTLKSFTDSECSNTISYYYYGKNLGEQNPFNSIGQGKKGKTK